jgi:FHS family Na+ dependent glucose MFS transporter 1
MTNKTSFTKTSESHAKRDSTIGYFGSFILLGLAAAILGPSLPYLAKNTNTLLDEISVLFVVRSLGYLLGSWISGHMFDRFPGHRLLSFGLILMVLTFVFVPQLTFLWILAVVMFILGFAEGAIDVGCNALLVLVHHEGVGPYMNALHSFFGIGALLAPIFIAQSLKISGDITLGYWLLMILIIPVIFWIGRLPSPEPKTSRDPNRDEEKISLRKAAIPIFGSVFLLFLYVGVEGGFGGWIYTYALEMDLANSSNAAYITSAFWGTFTLFRFLSIPLAARLRPRTILYTDLAGCLLSVGIIMLWPHSRVAIWVGAIGLGASLASIFPTTITLTERRITLTGQITSWFFIGAGLGSMFFPWLIGQFFATTGPISTMVIILANLILATLLLFGIAAQPHKEAV